MHQVPIAKSGVVSRVLIFEFVMISGLSPEDYCQSRTKIPNLSMNQHLLHRRFCSENSGNHSCRRRPFILHVWQVLEIFFLGAVNFLHALDQSDGAFARKAPTLSFFHFPGSRPQIFSFSYLGCLVIPLPIFDPIRLINR